MAGQWHRNSFYVVEKAKYSIALLQGCILRVPKTRAMKESSQQLLRVQLFSRTLISALPTTAILLSVESRFLFKFVIRARIFYAPRVLYRAESSKIRFFSRRNICFFFRFHKINNFHCCVTIIVNKLCPYFPNTDTYKLMTLFGRIWMLAFSQSLSRKLV